MFMRFMPGISGSLLLTCLLGGCAPSMETATEEAVQNVQANRFEGPYQIEVRQPDAWSRDLLLSGTVSSPEDSKRMQQIVSSTRGVSSVTQPHCG